MWHPEATAVGPAIADNTVKQWPLRLLADSALEQQKRGAVMLLGLDCTGDICELPPCLTQDPDHEFFERPDASCNSYDPNAEGWRSAGPGYGAAYLIGRGNVYIGPHQQPAFEVVADSATDFVKVDHWIANGNPRAVVIVTPKGPQTASTKYFGVRFRQVDRSWGIVAEQDGAIIPAGSRFNVYVMGDMGGSGPGYAVHDLSGETQIWLDDPLLNKNPNGVVFTTHVVARWCSLPDDRGRIEDLPGRASDDGPDCSSGHFPHPIGVRYDGRRGQWAIVSLDGTPFPLQVTFNVFAAGLAGTYRRSMWQPGETPEYARRMETIAAAAGGSATPLAGFDNRDRESLVFATQNLTPYAGSPASAPNLHPMGVDYMFGQWVVVNLDGAPMTSTAFNVVRPLEAP
ncbi:MAG: hypothetical protein ACE5GX_04260 [Thermoanaerobaculia bacterium]